MVLGVIRRPTLSPRASCDKTRGSRYGFRVRVRVKVGVRVRVRVRVRVNNDMTRT